MLVRVLLRISAVYVTHYIFPEIDRLRTIIGYDRICVLDAGQIAEYDTPENLFNMTEGIFRSMCERSGITLDEIERTRSKMA